MRAFTALWTVCAERYGSSTQAQAMRYGVQVNSLGLTEANPRTTCPHRARVPRGHLSKKARPRALQLRPGTSPGPAAPVGPAVVPTHPADLAFESDCSSTGHLRRLGGHREETAEVADPRGRAGERPRPRRCVRASTSSRGWSSQADRVADRDRELQSSGQLLHRDASPCRLVNGNAPGEPSLRSTGGGVRAASRCRGVEGARDGQRSSGSRRLRRAAEGPTRHARHHRWPTPGNYASGRGAPRGVREYRHPPRGGVGHRGRVPSRTRRRRPWRTDGGPPSCSWPNRTRRPFQRAEQIAVAAGRRFEVIYQGIRLSPAEIAAAARDEDVDVVGISICRAPSRAGPRGRDRLRAAGVGPRRRGGIIPPEDAGSSSARGAQSTRPRTS